MLQKRNQFTLNEYERTADGYVFSLYYRGGGIRPEKFLIDAQSFEKVKNHKWSYQGRYVKNNTLGLLHRFLLDYPETTVDHINGNSLDFRLCNLRVCDHKDNIRNSKLSKNNKTGFVGVTHYHFDKNRFEAYIHVSRKKIGLGIFDTSVEAAQAYNRAAKKYFGEFARLNIIKESK